MQADSRDSMDFVPGAPLEAILYTDELQRRPSRMRNDGLQETALKAMLRNIDGAAHSVLQALTDTMCASMQCDSAGVSLVSDDNSHFYWPAISGVLQPHVGEGTPRYFGPCGDVLEADAVLHMHHMDRRYPYLAAIPPIKEALLAPFHFNGAAVGTVWAIIHEPPHNLTSQRRPTQEFDSEDLRLLRVLSELATSAYEIWSGLRQSRET